MIGIILAVIIIGAMSMGYSLAQAKKHARMAQMLRQWSKDAEGGKITPEQGLAKVDVLKDLKRFKV